MDKTLVRIIIDTAEGLLQKLLMAYKSKPLKGLELDRMKALEDITQRLELFRLKLQ